MRKLDIHFPYYRRNEHKNKSPNSNNHGLHGCLMPEITISKQDSQLFLHYEKRSMEDIRINHLKARNVLNSFSFVYKAIQSTPQPFKNME